MATVTDITRYQVTEEQLDKCSRVIDLATNEVFYLVQSQTDFETTYTVKYLPNVKAMTCNCPAGQRGTRCWHVRAARKHAELYNEAVKAQVEAEARMKQEAEEAAKLDEMWEHEQRTQAAREAKAVKRDGAKAYQPRPFSLMR